MKLRNTMGLGVIKGALSAFLLAAIIMPSSAYAGDKISSLNEKNVRAFILDTADMTSSRDEFLPAEKIKAYLKRHLDDDAYFVTSITFKLPDVDPQETMMRFDKAQFMETVEKGAQNIKGYQSETSVDDIKLSWWGKTAVVNTQSKEYGFMPVPSPGGGAHGEDVPMESTSTCAQTLGLEKGVIKIKNSVCQTVVIFSE